MFNLTQIFNPKNAPTIMQKDEIATLLKTTPEALDAFEAAYQKH